MKPKKAPRAGGSDGSEHIDPWGRVELLVSAVPMLSSHQAPAPCVTRAAVRGGAAPLPCAAKAPGGRPKASVFNKAVMMTVWLTLRRLRTVPHQPAHSSVHEE